MFRRIALLLLLGAMFSQIARAQAVAPKLNFKERTLANGLRVISLEDHASPTVAIQVWYHVGGKDDPEHRSGFAHLFEHLMFKSTKNMKSEMMDRLTEDVGGANNAYTQPDVTVYYETIPSNYLETLLWAEAERMSNLNVDEANFKSERATVEEEFRQRILAPPYGRLDWFIEKMAFAKHPYNRSVIGSIEDLEAATLENVIAFHKTYYRPDNATLIVVGDFDQRQLDAWVDKYFGRVIKPALPLPRVEIQEPARAGEKRYVEYGQNVPLPAVSLNYLTVPRAHPDADALRVANSILSDGESSRLYHSLVYEQQLAQAVYAVNDLREDAGVFVFIAVMANGKTQAAGEQALLAEIKKMQDAPVSNAELEKAKNQLVTAKLHEMETDLGKAGLLGEAAVYLKDTNRVNTDLQNLQAVTAADVQRVMRKYFTPENRMVVYYSQESEKKTQTSAAKGAAKR
jgi:zinc protease